MCSQSRRTATIERGFSRPVAVVAAGLMFACRLNDRQRACAARLRTDLATLSSLVDEALNTLL